MLQVSILLRGQECLVLHPNIRPQVQGCLPLRPSILLRAQPRINIHLPDSTRPPANIQPLVQWQARDRASISPAPKCRDSIHLRLACPQDNTSRREPPDSSIRLDRGRALMARLRPDSRRPDSIRSSRDMGRRL